MVSCVEERERLLLLNICMNLTVLSPTTTCSAVSTSNLVTFCTGEVFCLCLKQTPPKVTVFSMQNQKISPLSISFERHHIKCHQYETLLETTCHKNQNKEWKLQGLCLTKKGNCITQLTSCGTLRDNYSAQDKNWTRCVKLNTLAEYRFILQILETGCRTSQITVCYIVEL